MDLYPYRIECYNIVPSFTLSLGSISESQAFGTALVFQPQYNGLTTSSSAHVRTRLASFSRRRTSLFPRSTDFLTPSATCCDDALIHHHRCRQAARRTNATPYGVPRDHKVIVPSSLPPPPPLLASFYCPFLPHPDSLLLLCHSISLCCSLPNAGDECCIDQGSLPRDLFVFPRVRGLQL